MPCFETQGMAVAPEIWAFVTNMNDNILSKFKDYANRQKLLNIDKASSSLNTFSLKNIEGANFLAPWSIAPQLSNDRLIYND